MWEIIVQNIWQSSFISVCGKFFAIDEGVGEGEGVGLYKAKIMEISPAPLQESQRAQGARRKGHITCHVKNIRK